MQVVDRQTDRQIKIDLIDLISHLIITVLFSSVTFSSFLYTVLEALSPLLTATPF